VNSARDEVIPRSFRSRLGEDRRLNFEKTALVEVQSRGQLKAMPQQDVALQLEAPEVKVAVSESQLFGGKLLAFASRDRDRRCFGWPDELDGRSANFDLARCQLVVAHLRWTERDLSPDDHDAFLSERRRFLYLALRRPLRVERDLHQSGAVSEIEEDQSAEVSRAMYPTAQRDRLSRVLRAQRASLVGSKRRFERPWTNVS
jgi:hypothetical protein